ncbi:MAG: amylo-alpha-1,6-glucosidase [Frankia sp.]|nr:amylo-alpha-1,6-glucosidase [Frankia sp.]
MQKDKRALERTKGLGSTRVTEAWAYGGGPPVSAQTGLITLVEGLAFCIADSAGDIRPGAEQGLFFRDTRFLNRFELTVDGEHLQVLRADCPTPYEATIITRRPPLPGLADSTLLVIRRRYVGTGMREDLTLRNLSQHPADVRLELAVDADFAGLFDVKEGRVRPREGIRRSAGPAEPGGGVLRLRYDQGAESRAVTVTGDSGASAADGRLTWRLVVPPRGERDLSVQVVPAVDGVEAAPSYRPGQPVETSGPATRLAAWRRVTPVLHTPDAAIAALVTRSAEDLGALRIIDPDHPDRTVVAAGAPWFMTLFGRDSLLTSWMLLPLDPTVALGTLRTLAERQGGKVDPRTEEEPGRIMHELRCGLDAEAALGGGSVYYGTIDATPLFVVLLGELRRWGLASADVDALLPHADRALEWIDRYGDRDGDGFVEYQRATERGLVNQGWKDSFDAISFADGTPATPPIALAEVQGYVYAAFVARAHFARETGDEEQSQYWAHRAATLKRQFNEQFWLPDRGYFALALDAEKRPVDALASNMGHCLWTGLVDEDKAASVARHLLSPEMFTGFGVRTLATTMGAYNPMSYHNGSVWPHDNALIAGGLMRYGFTAQAQRVALAVMDAGRHFGWRLPELFCGFDRADFPAPVPYPTSCSPQAWAAAAPLYLLRTLLRFDPWVPRGRVWCHPAVPPQLLPLRVERLHLAGATVSVSVTRSGWRVDGLPEGIELVRQPRRPLTADVPASAPTG